MTQPNPEYIGPDKSTGHNAAAGSQEHTSEQMERTAKVVGEITVAKEVDHFEALELALSLVESMQPDASPEDQLSKALLLEQHVFVLENHFAQNARLAQRMNDISRQAYIAIHTTWWGRLRIDSLA